MQKVTKLVMELFPLISSFLFPTTPELLLSVLVNAKGRACKNGSQVHHVTLALLSTNRTRKLFCSSWYRLFQKYFQNNLYLVSVQVSGKIKIQDRGWWKPSGTEEWAIAGWATQAIEQVRCHNRGGDKGDSTSSEETLSSCCPSQQSWRAYSHGCHILWTVQTEGTPAN